MLLVRVPAVRNGGGSGTRHARTSVSPARSQLRGGFHVPRRMDAISGKDSVKRVPAAISRVQTCAHRANFGPGTSTGYPPPAGLGRPAPTNLSARFSPQQTPPASICQLQYLPAIAHPRRIEGSACIKSVFYNTRHRLCVIKQKYSGVTKQFRTVFCFGDCPHSYFQKECCNGNWRLTR
jgi:hypothetical protein